VAKPSPRAEFSTVSVTLVFGHTDRMGRARQLTRLLATSVAALAIPLALFIGFAVTLIAPWQQSATARSRADVHHLAYGFPHTWIVQDQHGFTPRGYPQRIGFGNPRRSPMDIQPGPFFEDVAIIAGVVGGTLMLTAGAIRLVSVRRVRPATA
jgi:hypothetical protein